MILLAVPLGLAFALLFPGVKPLSVAAKVLVFVVLVASFDLLLGYTGIVSFAHTMFFGIGAYGIAIATTRMGATWSALAVGVGGALLLSLLLSLAVGLFSLRVRAIFFRHDHAGRGGGVQTLASQLSDFTGGEDGLSFRVPSCCRPASEPFENPSWAYHRWTAGHLLPAVCHGGGAGAGAAHRQLARLAACCRPSARTSSAPRPLATAWWCTAPRPACCRPFCVCGLPCWPSGCATTGPDTRSASEIMMDCLLIVVIGGMGTITARPLALCCSWWRKATCRTCCAWAARRHPACPGCLRCSRPTAGCCGWACCSCSRFTACPTGVVGAAARPLPPAS